MKSLPLILGCVLVLCSCVSGAAGRNAEPQETATAAQSPMTEPTASPVPTPTSPAPLLQSEKKYFADGVLDQYVMYAWSADKKHLLSRESFEATGTEPETRVAFEYSGDSLTSETTYEKSGAIRLKKKYIYDQSGRKLEEQHFDAKGKLILSYKKKFDDAGRTSSWSIFDSASLPLAENDYIYDNGRPVSIQMKDGFGETVGTVKLTCDASGRETGREYLAPDKQRLSSEVMRYEGGNLSSEEKRGPDGAVLHTIKYAYDQQDRLERKTEIDGHGDTVSETVFTYVNQ